MVSICSGIQLIRARRRLKGVKPVNLIDRRTKIRNQHDLEGVRIKKEKLKSEKGSRRSESNDEVRSSIGGRLGIAEAKFFSMRIEMFIWQRPDDFPPGEPSEAVIWDAIDRHDPRGDADV
ncbi:hypothetical protein M5K25_020604 [Dendrobium thyrsiflorum]|uniref:Uncharacterized protein n=1 Tax=Dendrobium thyrsiflorum TaxID=117978 RepID=A0ABD0UAG6_DENTH